MNTKLYLVPWTAITVGCLIFSSCTKKESKRVYEEITVAPSVAETMNGADPQAMLKEMLARGEDPHAFLKNNAQSFDDTGSIEPSASSNETSVHWNVPSGWREMPGGGMRLVSFKSDASPDVDISIVTLSGSVGGLMANINRWLGQIKLPALSESEFDEFISHQPNLKNKDGLLIRLVDFSSLLNNGGPQALSILAGILEFDEQTIFVKMIGPVSAIDKNREAFKSLCESLRFQE